MMIILPTTTIGWRFLLLTGTRLHFLSFMIDAKEEKKKEIFVNEKLAESGCAFYNYVLPSNEENSLFSFF